MLLHLASWYPKKYCLTCLLGIPVLPAKKGKNPLPNQLNQCNELIKGETKIHFFNSVTTCLALLACMYLSL